MELLLGCGISLFLLLLDTAQLFSKVIIAVYILTNGIGEFLMLLIFSNTFDSQSFQILANVVGV